MPLDELAHGEPFGRGLVVGELRHVLRRARQLVAEQDFATQLPLRIGLVREAPDCFASVAARPENPAPAVLLDAVHAPPLGPGDAGDAVVLRQASFKNV